MSAFVDTSAFYAVIDRDDDLHEAAGEEWERLVSGDEALLTSNYVVVECFALIQNRLGIPALRLFQDDILPIVGVAWVSEEDHRAATQAVMAAGRRELSFVDCSSFQVMRRLGMERAFAFDADFQEQGFAVLPDRAS